MNKEEIIKKGKEVVRIETNAISDLINSIDDEFVKALQILYESKGRVVLTGMGKSGLIARKIVATLNSTGTASIYLHPTDALHGDLGMVRKEDVVIMISKSGATEELANLIPMLKRLNVKLIAMTGNRDSKLESECDVLLNVGVKEEACPFDLAPTASSTAALVMGDALAVVLLQMRDFTEEDFAVLHPGGSLGKRLSLSIKEIMHKEENVPVVKEDTSIKDVIFEISSKRLGTTTVVDKDGKLTGVVTDGDLRRLLEKTMDIKALKAKDIMTHNPKVMKDSYLASFALQTMENFKITTLIIVNDLNKPVGIIHLHDLVKLGIRQR